MQNLLNDWDAVFAMAVETSWSKEINDMARIGIFYVQAGGLIKSSARMKNKRRICFKRTREGGRALRGDSVLTVREL